MGTLGKYLKDARESRQLDLRDAAQQTRISINYLKALEEEDFARLPGEVFVKGFLKNYSRFLHLDESEVLKKYGELKPLQPPSGTAATGQEQADIVDEQKTDKRPFIESFIWAGGILIILVILFFTAFPTHRSLQTQPAAILSHSSQTTPAPGLAPFKQDKLYLEVVALEDTWLLVRIDSSPQKNAVLKKGETLTWSADERFQLSYASAGALKLSLNGKELVVNESKNVVVRDLTVTASGVVNRNLQTEYTKPKPKRQPTAQPRSAGTTTVDAQKPAPAETPRAKHPTTPSDQSPVAPEEDEPAVSSPTKPATPDSQ
jgi:transcriptional regulator with XRE-family HTH domain